MAMMVGQFIGGAQLISQAAGIDYVLGLLVFGVVVIAYTTTGGFKAVAITDTVCALLMLVGMGVLAADIIGQAGGLSSLMQKITQEANAGQAQAFLRQRLRERFPGLFFFHPGSWWALQR